MPSSPREELLGWADTLEAYARDWDASFGKTEYFTQEYWYTFMGVLTAYWKNRPLNMGQLQGLMKDGAPNTRRARIQNAIDDGYFKTEEVGRETLIVPTEKLRDLMIGHLQRTLNIARDRIC